MTAKADELNTKIIVLTEQVSAFIQAAKDFNKDHEERIRVLEGLVSKLDNLIVKLDGKVDKEIGVLKERATVSNILQATLTSVASVVAAVLGTRK